MMALLNSHLIGKNNNIMGNINSNYPLRWQLIIYEYTQKQKKTVL